MKRIIILVSIFLVPVGLFAEPLKPVWTVTGEVQNPESAYFDPETNFIYISSIAGGPATKDKLGWISKIALSGKVIASQWVKGLNAPKGMRSHKGTLWVADINEVVEIELKSGKILSRTTIPSATFLNDVAIGPDGTIYISDNALFRIFQMKGKSATIFAEGMDLAGPNGLLIKGNELIVAGFGGQLFALDLKTKKKRVILDKGIGNLDGLEIDTAGNFLVTDWMNGRLLQISPQGKVKELLTGQTSPADIGFVPAKKLLILPRLNDSVVSAYQLP